MLANDERTGLLDLAIALRPPPRIDYNWWAETYVQFPPGSPLPGRYNPDLFPWNRRIFDVLGPDHPAREITLLGSAQVGKTLIAQVFVAASMDFDPSGILYCQATEANAIRLARTKWRLQIRTTPRMQVIFDPRQSKEGGNSTLYQESRDRLGWVQFSGANSAASLSMISVKRVVLDDLSKWENNEAGDPEYQAISRAKAYREAKIFSVGTGLLENKCRMTRSFMAGTQEYFEIPCPHCGHRHPLDPHNFIANIDRGHPERAHFTCPACNSKIEQRHRAAIVAAGEWIAHNPGVPRISFHLWAAYAPLEPWEAIARGWLAAEGDQRSEQVWWNDTAGQAYSVPGDSPPWGELKERAEAGGRPRGLVPREASILTMGVDIQDLHCEAVVCGFGRDFKRYFVEHIVVEGHISTEEAQAELRQLITRAWPAETGPDRYLDLIAIDGGAWQSDVYGFVSGFPKSKVIMTRGVAGDDKPPYASVLRERRRDGTLVKYRGRYFNLGVNGLKGGLYKALRITDPNQRGYISFPQGLEDSFFEQLTSEKRVLQVDRRGFASWVWVKPASVKNECLDCSNYAEAAGTMKGWRTMTAEAWDILEKRLSGAPPPPAPAMRGGAPAVELSPARMPPEPAPAGSPTTPPNSAFAGYRFA